MADDKQTAETGLRVSAPLPESKYESHCILRETDWAGRSVVRLFVSFTNNQHARRLGTFEDEAAAIKFLNRFYPEVSKTPRTDTAAA